MLLRDRNLHHRHHGRRLFSGHDLGTGILRLERLDVLGRKVDDEVDLSGLEGRHLSDGVLDHAYHDAIEVREALIVVFVEAIHDQVAALHPLHEAERSAPHHRLRLPAPPVLERVLLRGGWRVEYEPHAVRGQHVQHEPVRLLESDLDGVRIEDLDRVHVLVVGPHAGPRRWVHDAVDAELDGGSVDPGAVVEQDVLP